MRVFSSPNLLPDLAESAGFVVGRFATLISVNLLFDAAASRFNSGAGTLGHGKTPGLYRFLDFA